MAALPRTRPTLRLVRESSGITIKETHARIIPGNAVLRCFPGPEVRCGSKSDVSSQSEEASTDNFQCAPLVPLTCPTFASTDIKVPRWYVVRADIDESGLTPVEHLQTFCPYKGLCSYYDIGDARLAAWSYRDAYSEVSRISDLVSFEPEIVSVQLDGIQLRLEPGQTVIPHGPDRDLEVREALRAAKA